MRVFSIYNSVFLIAFLFFSLFIHVNISYSSDSNNNSEWTGGEDVSYDYDLEDLIPLEYYDMYIETPITKKLPKPLINKHKKPIIAIVIDDMGVNRKMSEKAIESLNPNVTLSFLPYSDDIQKQVNRAKKLGHEVMLHLPWEPNRKTANPGPNSLLTNSSIAEISNNLEINLNKFKGYDGVNNHMGSKFSSYRTGIEIVMNELKKRGVFFLDSRTIGNTIAEKVAKEYSVPTTHRNVFLDHVETKSFIKKALRNVERIALSQGSAVAIGHPKKMTIDALNAWIPRLKAKGFKLVKLKYLIKKRQIIYTSDASYIQKFKVVK